jgi:hypothetical protein
MTMAHKRGFRTTADDHNWVARLASLPRGGTRPKLADMGHTARGTGLHLVSDLFSVSRYCDLLVYLPDRGESMTTICD